ncbi:hypothetical protein [Streptomyces californicus]|uniref:hypothetical protein n=1 Tax=Streptomyces californicus TaxID=67351 RepID=UPI0036CCCCFD
MTIEPPPCGYVEPHSSHTFMRMEVLFQCPGPDGTEGEDVPAREGGILAWLNDAIIRAKLNAEHSLHHALCPFWGDCLPAACPHDETENGPIHREAKAALRRCEADQKLLRLHGGNMHSCPATDDTGYLDEWTQFGYEDACPVLRLLAEGYGWTEGER